jgi:hypothetical protein
MAVTGMKAVLSGIADALDARKAAAEAVALDTARKGVRMILQRQSADRVPDGRAVADTAVKKQDAIAFAKAKQGGDPVTAMGIPWTNRSGRAAKSVFADAGVDNESVYFHLYHTMSYGVYLELAHGRKYAVIEPIVRSLAPEFLEKVKKIYAP